jgi:hypothetical protein
VSGSYPVYFDTVRPQRFDRLQLLFRVAIFVALSLLLVAVWLVSLLYVAIPVIAAAFAQRDDPEHFRREGAPRLREWLHWLLAFDAYITLLIDRFPLYNWRGDVRFEIEEATTPSLSSALMRMLYSLPSAVALAVLGLATVVTWIIAAVMILVREDYEDSLYRYHCGVVRWAARLLAYHASLTDRYPPFEIDTGEHSEQIDDTRRPIESP